MNILQINKFFHVCDGTSRYFFNVSKLLEEKGHRVLFFSMEHPQNLPSIYSKYFVSNISYRENILQNTLKILSRMFYSIEARNQIKRLLDESSTDLVHIHSIYHHISPAIILEIKKRRIPIVMTIEDYHLISPNYLLFHDDRICEITKRRQFYKAILHRCVKNSYIASTAEVVEKYIYSLLGWEKDLIDFFITPSVFMKNKLVEYGFSEEKIIALPHFLDANDYQPNSGVGEYLLYFGRLYEEKGLLFLLEVMKSLPEINCVIVGEGPERRKLLNLIKKERLRNIILSKWSSGKELNGLISKSRFTILPSKWYEGFGLTIIESNACGKPVIASRIGGIPEVIKDGITGFLFEPGNVQDCVNKVERLWDDSNLVKKMGQNARSYVEKKFNQEKHYIRLMKIYGKAIKQNRMQG